VGECRGLAARGQRSGTIKADTTNYRFTLGGALRRQFAAAGGCHLIPNRLDPFPKSMLDLPGSAPAQKTDYGIGEIAWATMVRVVYIVTHRAVGAFGVFPF